MYIQVISYYYSLNFTDFIGFNVVVVPSPFKTVIVISEESDCTFDNFDISTAASSNVWVVYVTVTVIFRGLESPANDKSAVNNNRVIKNVFIDFPL